MQNSVIGYHFSSVCERYSVWFCFNFSADINLKQDLEIKPTYLVLVKLHPESSQYVYHLLIAQRYNKRYYHKA